MELPRFYPILDSALLHARGLTVLSAAQALLDAGVRILQVRRKEPFPREVFDDIDRLVRLCEAAGATLVLNDRTDLALLLGCGLHLGQDDQRAADARALLGSQPIIGLSTHNEGQLRAGDGKAVDYLALGPVFPTRSKANPDPVIGLPEFARLRRLTTKPLVGIGGITRENALRVLEAGADCVALIGDLLPAESTARSLRERAAEWLTVLYPKR